MASGLYGKYKEACLVGQTHASYVQCLTDNIILIAVSSGYVVDLVNHQFISDIGGANIVARSGNLTGKSGTQGVFNAATEVIASVTGNPIIAIIVAKNTGTDATSPLMTYIDTATGLPDTPNGSAISFIPDPGAAAIFKL